MYRAKSQNCLGFNLLYISLKISKNVFIHALLHVYDKNYIITEVHWHHLIIYYTMSIV